MAAVGNVAQVTHRVSASQHGISAQVCPRWGSHAVTHGRKHKHTHAHSANTSLPALGQPGTAVALSAVVPKRWSRGRVSESAGVCEAAVKRERRERQQGCRGPWAVEISARCEGGTWASRLTERSALCDLRQVNSSAGGQGGKGRVEEGRE